MKECKNVSFINIFDLLTNVTLASIPNCLNNNKMASKKCGSVGGGGGIGGGRGVV